MQTRQNVRRYKECYIKGRHLMLNELRREMNAAGLSNKYLFKENIPLYPRPEFRVSQLKHDTNQSGLRGIRKDCAFRNPGKGSLLWWNLPVGPDEITSAEKRLLENIYPDRTEEQVQKQQSFLKKFATSPAFKENSRLGSYRFTFPLEELLNAYSNQFCFGDQPQMRVYETVLYKQEVMYVVLVHSPANQEQFSAYTLLADDPKAVCSYKDGCFIWRPEAMSETHRYQLIQDDEKQVLMVEMWNHEFYVWDNVAVALHVDEQVLKFDPERLRGTLKFCDKATVSIVAPWEFNTFPEAEKVVKELWLDCMSPLERADQLDKKPAGSEK